MRKINHIASEKLATNTKMALVMIIKNTIKSEIIVVTLENIKALIIVYVI